MTRKLFAGNLIKHPAYLSVKKRVPSNLEVTDRVMNNAFFIGVYPGITDEMLEYIGDIFKLICELESSEELSVLLYPNLLPMSSFSHYVGKLNTIGRAIRYILTHTPILRKKISIYRTNLLEKLSVDYNFALPGKLNNVLFTNSKRYYYGDIEVFILPRSIIVKLCNELLFDEHFINAMEDHDILLRLSSLNISYKKINYEIGLYYNS
jgi:hypothetical protein